MTKCKHKFTKEIPAGKFDFVCEKCGKLKSSIDAPHPKPKPAPKPEPVVVEDDDNG